MSLVKRNTAYSVNDIVNTKYGVKLTCTTAGTTSTDPLILDGTSPIADGTVVWEIQEEQGGGEYTQVLVTGVTGASSSSPYYKRLAINATSKFILPPIDILQESTAESETVIVSSFNIEDASSFNHNNAYVEFDGSLHLKIEYNVPMSTPVVITDGTNTGYISESANIDFGDWVNVGGVDVR